MTDTKIPLSAHKVIVACLEEELAKRDAVKDEDDLGWEIASWTDFGKDEFGYIEDGCAYVRWRLATRPLSKDGSSILSIARMMVGILLR
jgi:hypothetical protein